MKLTSELALIKSMVQKLLLLIGHVLPLTYLILDGQFGNNNALQMTLQCGLQLISKLRHDAALHFAPAQSNRGPGAPKKYGDRIDYYQIPQQYLKADFVEGDIRTRIYQIEALHQEFAQPLNLVIIVKTNCKTQTHAHVILFSSDLLIDYYSGSTRNSGKKGSNLVKICGSTRNSGEKRS